MKNVAEKNQALPGKMLDDSITLRLPWVSESLFLGHLHNRRVFAPAAQLALQVGYFVFNKDASPV
ncbi:MAG: hypothetical protein HY774_05985 [Acidobacteria bacterium]|nr:hypothetical protein [Acidobacteriota bacterium]